MNTDKRCTGATRQGLPCRNRPARNTSPPLCWRHLRTQEPATNPRTPVATTANLDDAGTADLSAELRLVRDVLSLLADQLDDASCEMTVEDLRTLATLIYSGVRTVAYLLGRQPERSANLERWLDQALDVLAVDLDSDL